MTTLSLAQVEKWVPLAEELGVSEVARSRRGFLTALRQAGSVTALPEKWRKRREAFIARHMAQVDARGEGLWNHDGTPTRRHLALIMWAYSPTKNPTTMQKNPAQISEDPEAIVEVLRHDGAELYRIHRPVVEDPRGGHYLAALLNLKSFVRPFVELSLEALSQLPESARPYMVSRAEHRHFGLTVDKGIISVYFVEDPHYTFLKYEARIRGFQIPDDVFDEMQAMASTINNEGQWYWASRPGLPRELSGFTWDWLDPSDRER